MCEYVWVLASQIRSTETTFRTFIAKFTEEPQTNLFFKKLFECELIIDSMSKVVEKSQIFLTMAQNTMFE